MFIFIPKFFRSILSEFQKIKMCNVKIDIMYYVSMRKYKQFKFEAPFIQYNKFIYFLKL